ncbi:defective in methylation-7 protein [Purpureocillium lavendulum]|uniref:Defective in methylation-7 protein n=1 Tax=Purpureocillium lavendulum TaxID=1247861 RepID=A0AB34FJR5_9HYPO|nr:defective in methylation-7 protein [Purpureocillium lavendulum]
MAGRRRRASTSSVDTIDESQIRWRQEVSVVRSVPKEESPDDWPIFELRDAVVLNKDGQSLENALHVGIRGPFLVRGNLIIDDVGQRSHRTYTPPYTSRRAAR